MDNRIDDNMTYKVIGCAMKVHNTLDKLERKDKFKKFKYV